jgi:chemotaxis protein MotB
MNLLRFLSIILIAILILPACVSKKKYTASEVRVNHLRRDSAQFAREISELKEMRDRDKTKFEEFQNQTDLRIASLTSQLEAQGEELSDKDMMLQERAERLQALESRLEQQQAIVDELRKSIEEALVGFEDEDLDVEVRNGLVYISFSDKLLFPSGSARLNKGGIEAIGLLGEVLKENPDINIAVVGHTDSIPISTSTYRDNWDLSSARAKTITRQLIDEEEIDGARLTASGRSKYEPVASNSTREGRAKNRRTEIVLTPKLEELFKILEGPPASE